MVLNRLKVCFNAIMLISFLLIVGVFFAISAEAEEVNEERKENILEELCIQPLEEFEYKKAFNNYDVNANGEAIVSFNGWHFKAVAVFDKNGVFQYGYKCSTSNIFAVEWNGRYHNLVLSKNNIILTLDDSANCIEMKECDKSYYYDLCKRKEITIGNSRYIQKNWLSFGEGHGYKLVSVSSDNIETVIYEIGTTRLVLQTAFMVLFVVVFSLGMSKLIKKMIKDIKENNQKARKSVQE